MIVDCAHYRDGRRQHEGPLEIEAAAAKAKGDGDFVWLGLHDPGDGELDRIAAAFDLHELAVEDAKQAHQRPKLEDYDDSYFIVLRPARYDDEREELIFGEIHVFAGPGYVIAVRHGEASELAGARRHLEGHEDLLRAGPAAVVWAILDKVVDDYAPVVAGIEDDIEEVETEIFQERARLHAEDLLPEARGDRVPPGGFTAARPAGGARARRVRERSTSSYAATSVTWRTTPGASMSWCWASASC